MLATLPVGQIAFTYAVLLMVYGTPVAITWALRFLILRRA
jgi:hypothetical protein